ncbi:MAG: hypothetical protein ABJA85_03955 [Bacteroidota bacterium]
MNKYIFILFVSLLIFMAISFIPHHKLKIDGVWKIIEVQTVKSNGTSISTYPSESQVLFTHNYYSFCWTSHNSSVRNWQMPDSVKLARMNQSIINTGTYELRDSILTTKAIFAMNPMFVEGLAKFKCAFIGDTLILTGLSLYSSDNIPNPVYANGSHIVNKLVKVNDIK